MGGRGSSYGGTNSALGTKDVDELRKYMRDNYGIAVHSSADKVDFNVLRSVAGEIESIIKEFPQIAGPGIHELSGNESRPNAYASATLRGSLQLNPKLLSDADTLNKSYSDDVSSKWHPAGTTSVNIASHEMGHLLESALIFKNITEPGYQGTMDRINAWNKNRFATKIVGEAARIVKKTESGKGLKNNQLVEQISRYATKNRSEALAEAVADYRANGNNAQPLSKAIWNILKRELG